jgi:hypothetical protein
MWNMKWFLLPAITRATGIVIKGLKNPETVWGKLSTDSIKKDTRTRDVARSKERAAV